MVWEDKHPFTSNFTAKTRVLDEGFDPQVHWFVQKIEIPGFLNFHGDLT